MARRVRLSLLDRSIAPAFRAKQISAGPTMAISMWKREKKNPPATDTYALVPAKTRFARVCLSTGLQLQSSGPLRLTDKTTRCRFGAQATPSNPSSRAPTTQPAGPALYSSRLGNARGWTRLFALLWQQPGQTLRAVDPAFFQLAGWRLGQGLDEKDSKSK